MNQMNMNGLGAYSAMQTNSYTAAAKGRQAAKTEGKQTEAAKKTENSTLQMSDKAKALLQELKKTYGNMDFFVAEYASDEEAAQYLSRGLKDYSVLIDPEELERMANDDEVKKQNLSLLDEAVGKLDQVKEELKGTDREKEVASLGVTIGKDGQVSYFAELEKAGERQKEFVDKIVEDKREAAKEAAKDAETQTVDKNQEKYNYQHSKRATVSAGSVEELLQKIQGFDWNSVKEETSIPMPGGRFDFTV